MSSGNIQAKIMPEMWCVGSVYVGSVNKGENCKVRHSILVLVYTAILEGQTACYSGQTLDVQWCCLLINLFSLSKG